MEMDAAFRWLQGEQQCRSLMHVEIQMAHEREVARISSIVLDPAMMARRETCWHKRATDQPTNQTNQQKNKLQEELCTVCSAWADHARAEMLAELKHIACAAEQVAAEDEVEEQVAPKRRKVEPTLSAPSAPRPAPSAPSAPWHSTPTPPADLADPINDWICALTELGVVFDAWLMQDLKQLRDADCSAGARLVHRMQRDLSSGAVWAPTNYFKTALTRLRQNLYLWL
jgi:hypothetical protein